MPVWYTHNIKNISDNPLTTLWINEPYNEEDPDTFYEMLILLKMSVKKINLVTVVGTRPEIIRLSRVIMTLEVECI